MKCPRCQHENRSGAKFCEECATPLSRTCPSCGSQLSATAKFCSECAHSVAGATPPAGRFASPQSYTPKHLAEKILTGKAALEGERKQVTVLFADLKGSMELLADRDPEEARQILDPVLERMMAAVHLYEGTVNQVMGDGIMALFGAPLAHEDHAVRACYAALRMQESVTKYATEVSRSHRAFVKIRVGLNSGEVVVRSIGSDLHMDYSAIGQTTHLAARMEQIAAPETIAIAPATVALTEGFVQVRSLGPTLIKGLATPVDLYELIGTSGARSRLQATAPKGLTRFTGRTAEIAQLQEALDVARGGKGQIVAVVGEPGVGKSRLFWEFKHSRATAGCLVLEAGSVSYGKATPYYPVIELLKSYFAIDARDGGQSIRDNVTERLLSLDRALEPSVPALLSLVTPGFDDEHWKQLEPWQRRQHTLNAVKRLLLRESQVQPVIAVFEDLHWVDGETQATLDALVESVPTARMLLLLNYRPEYKHEWGSRTYYRQLRTDPLPAATAAELLESLLGPDPTLAPLKHLLVERTEGNPFFAEEAVRTFVEANALEGHRGAYRLTREITAFNIPATAQAVLAARIDRLAPDDKRRLQAAAVIGRDIPLSVLLAVADEDGPDLEAGIARLQGAEFLYESRLFPDVEYTFKHALTQEVAYGSLLQETRKTLHGRIVGAIEGLYPGRLSEHLERLAHHAVHGELWKQAATYAEQAGAKALARSANREALGYLDQALTALQHLPETRETLEQAVDLRFGQRTALYALGEFERIVSCLREIESLATTLGDQRRLGQMSVHMCMNLWTTGQPTEALGFGRSARRIAESLADVPLQVVATHHLAVASLGAGDYPQAADLLGKALRLLETDRSAGQGSAGIVTLLTRIHIMARVHLTWICTDLGKFEEGIAQGQESLRLADALDEPYSQAYGHWILAYLMLTRGEFGDAVGLLERGLALSREWNLSLFSVIHIGSLGYAYAVSGRRADGIALLEDALRDAQTMSFGALQPLFLCLLGESYVLEDRVEDAFELAQHALNITRESGQRPYNARASRLLADVIARRDLTESADSHYREAFALADDLKMRPLSAHCHLGLGQLYRRMGQREQAQEHLATALTMYREMAMTHWLETVEL